MLVVRLTGNPNVHVSVLEASKDRNGDILTSVPALCTKLLGNPEDDWMVKTVAQVCRV